MRFKKFFSIAIGLAAAISILPSCKEEEETESLYFNGSITLSYPLFVVPGYEREYNIDTLTTLNKSGDYTKIGYLYSDHLSVRDTLIDSDGTVRHKTFKITAPDDLATYSVYISGYADGYYSSSAFAYYTVVTDESITGIIHDEGQKKYTDPRDGNEYYIAKSDSTEWLEPNLAWKGSGKSYESCDIMTPVFGNFYTWEEARTACPEGWHLPSDKDWVKLALAYGAPSGSAVFSDIDGAAGELMADAYFNSAKMWEYWPKVSLSNKSRLGVIPVGYATVSDGEYKFSGIYNRAVFWTSDEYEGRGIYRAFYVDQNIIFSGLGSKTDMAASVRCVR